jgi:hypothetical protein
MAASFSVAILRVSLMVAPKLAAGSNVAGYELDRKSPISAILDIPIPPIRRLRPRGGCAKPCRQFRRSRMKMKIAGLLAVIALLAGPASAQMPQPHVQNPGEPDPVKTQSQIQSEKEAERAYRRSLGNIQEQKSADPWGIARGGNAAPKAAAKEGAKAAPAKPKAPKDAAKTAAKPETSAKQ